MSAAIHLCHLERYEGAERVAARFVQLPSGAHALEIARERLTLDGWKLRYRELIFMSEVFLFSDAVQRACALAGTVRR